MYQALTPLPDIPLSVISMVLGGFMIGIGIWGIIKIRKYRKQSLDKE